jgi:hypothetical protein
MKDKIINWLTTYRTPIGCFVGAINIMSGVIDIMIGNNFLGLFWIALGALIIFDLRPTK